MMPAMPMAPSPSAMTVISGVERALDAVEGDEPLARPRPPHHERAAAQPGEIVRVHRLAQLEHHVVGGVHDVVDRAHADRLEPRQPLGRGPDLDAADRPPRGTAGSRSASSSDPDATDGAGARRAAGARERRVAAAPGICGSRNGVAVAAASSRATPLWASRSGRLGPDVDHEPVSPSGSASSNGVPGAASVSSSRIPSCSSPSPSSRAEQSMPSEFSPRILPLLDLEPCRRAAWRRPARTG